MKRPAKTKAQRQYDREQRALLRLRRAAVRWSECEEHEDGSATASAGGCSSDAPQAFAGRAERTQREMDRAGAVLAKHIRRGLASTSTPAPGIDRATYLLGWIFGLVPDRIERSALGHAVYSKGHVGFHTSGPDGYGCSCGDARGSYEEISNHLGDNGGRWGDAA